MLYQQLWPLPLGTAQVSQVSILVLSMSQVWQLLLCSVPLHAMMAGCMQQECASPVSTLMCNETSSSQRINQKKAVTTDWLWKMICIRRRCHLSVNTCFPRIYCTTLSSASEFIVSKRLEVRVWEKTHGNLEHKVSNSQQGCDGTANGWGECHTPSECRRMIYVYMNIPPFVCRAVECAEE